MTNVGRLLLMSKPHCNASADLAHPALAAFPAQLLLLSGGPGASLNPVGVGKPKHVLRKLKASLGLGLELTRRAHQLSA